MTGEHLLPPHGVNNVNFYTLHISRLYFNQINNIWLYDILLLFCFIAFFIPPLLYPMNPEKGSLPVSVFSAAAQTITAQLGGQCDMRHRY